MSIQNREMDSKQSIEESKKGNDSKQRTMIQKQEEIFKTE
jgi:stalled ribosome alternative rescue factor ArfA